MAHTHDMRKKQSMAARLRDRLRARIKHLDEQIALTKADEERARQRVEDAQANLAMLDAQNALLQKQVEGGHTVEEAREIASQLRALADEYEKVARAVVDE